jgi:hypothetical protein
LPEIIDYKPVNEIETAPAHKSKAIWSFNRKSNHWYLARYSNMKVVYAIY